MASTIATASSLVIVCLAGLVRRRTRGGYPWIQVSAAMLCAYLLLNKVHSPQYVLWLIPFLVLVRVPAPWILGYFLADAFVGVGFLQRLAAGTSSIEDSVWPQIYLLGVWGRSILLALLIVVFLRADTAWRGAEVSRSGTGPSTERGGGITLGASTRSFSPATNRAVASADPLDQRPLAAVTTGADDADQQVVARRLPMPQP